ncbi:hypothetical protein M9Y10_029758 [Tritrichomonas musculus]|uniref:Uncharacterized protein n=1 Tax=Tritrichomonas musculus TaxID=1915356 RepID=A0ABR2KN50_9EUKA
MNTKKDERFRFLEKDHSLVYKDKEFKYDYDICKKNSNYMKRNQSIFATNEKNELCHDNEEIDFNDDSINALLNYCHFEEYKYLMNDANVIQIYYLAELYEVDGLIKETKKYILENCNQIALDLCAFKTDLKNFEKPLFEDIISAKLVTFINDEKLLKLDVPTMYRILANHKIKYQNNNENIEDQIMELKFKYLKKWGKKASILFSDSNFGNMKIDYVRRLFSDEYENIFDFNMINSSLLKSIYENQSEHTKLLYKNFKEKDDLINKMKKEFDQITAENAQIKNEMIQMKTNNSQLKKEFDQIQTENAQMKTNNSQLKKEFDQIKAENAQMKREIEQIKTLINQPKNKANENIQNLQVEINNLESKLKKKIKTDINIEDYKIKKVIEEEKERCNQIQNINRSLLTTILSNGITSVYLPNDITCINAKMFFECDKLKEISLPPSLKIIEDMSFYGCLSLQKIIIPNTVTTIGKNAFLDCSSLTELSIPSSIKIIGEGCFKGCLKLVRVSLCASITVIEPFTFSSCKSLTEISIPSSVINIENFAFYGCDNLGKVSFAGSIKSIGDGAFNECPKLTCISIPKSTITTDSTFNKRVTTITTY